MSKIFDLAISVALFVLLKIFWQSWTKRVPKRGSLIVGSLWGLHCRGRYIYSCLLSTHIFSCSFFNCICRSLVIYLGGNAILWINFYCNVDPLTVDENQSNALPIDDKFHSSFTEDEFKHDYRMVLPSENHRRKSLDHFSSTANETSSVW